MPDMLTNKEDGTWHYHTEDSLPQEYRDVSSRAVDDLCPRAQLNKLVKLYGPVHLSTQQQEDGQVVIHDLNETWNKISSQLPTFEETVCGKDLQHSAVWVQASMPMSLIRIACMGSFTMMKTT